MSERDVGRGHEPGAAPECVPLNEGDHRCGAGVDGVEHAPERVRVRDVLIVGKGGRSAHPLDVGSGTEARPLACKNDGARPADIDERLGEILDQRPVERVARLGAGESDAEDVVVVPGAGTLCGVACLADCKGRREAILRIGFLG